MFELSNTTNNYMSLSLQLLNKELISSASSNTGFIMKMSNKTSQARQRMDFNISIRLENSINSTIGGVGILLSPKALNH